VLLDTSGVLKQVSRMHWLDRVDDQTIGEVHRVVSAVVEIGGAVGWLEVPTPADIGQWLGEWHGAATTGRAGLALCRVNGQVQAVGGWQAGREGPLGHVVQLSKIMVHPDARGLGLGRTVVDALIERADDFGAELLTLGVRGNNHGARALYESCGFQTWGVLPNGVAVGDDRFDDVRMCRQLGLPTNTVIHGSTAGGLGGSPLRPASRVTVDSGTTAGPDTVVTIDSRWTL
jgi:ribosomal protein S18 acetylase RimI-like enzyme